LLWEVDNEVVCEVTDTGQVAGQVAGQATDEVEKVILVMNGT